MTEEQNKLADEIERCLKYLSVRHFKHDAEISDVLTRCSAALREPAAVALKPGDRVELRNVNGVISAFVNSKPIPITWENPTDVWEGPPLAPMPGSDNFATDDFEREPATEAVLAQGDKLMQAKLSGFNDGLEEAARACENHAITVSNTDDAVATCANCAASIRALKGKGASQGASGRKCWRCGNPMDAERPFCPESKVAGPCMAADRRRGAEDPPAERERPGRINPTHAAADAFWKYWKENGETHKHGYYESTWGAINAALAAASADEQKG